MKNGKEKHSNYLPEPSAEAQELVGTLERSVPLVVAAALTVLESLP